MVSASLSCCAGRGDRGVMVVEPSFSFGELRCLGQLRKATLKLMKRGVELLEFPQGFAVHGLFLPVSGGQTLLHVWCCYFTAYSYR